MTTVVAHRPAVRHVMAKLVAAIAIAIQVTLPSPRALTQLAGRAATGVAAGEGERKHEQGTERRGQEKTSQGNQEARHAQLQTVTLSEQVSMKK